MVGKNLPVTSNSRHHGHFGTNLGVGIKNLSHMPGDTNTAMRGGISRDVTSMHGNGAIDTHHVIHRCPAESRTCRFAVAAHIHIAAHYIAPWADVVTVQI